MEEVFAIILSPRGKINVYQGQVSIVLKNIKVSSMKVKLDAMSPYNPKTNKVQFCGKICV